MFGYEGFGPLGRLVGIHRVRVSPLLLPKTDCGLFGYLMYYVCEGTCMPMEVRR